MRSGSPVWSGAHVIGEVRPPVLRRRQSEFSLERAYKAGLGFVSDRQGHLKNGISARRFTSSFAPKTAFGVWLRNFATKAMVIPPVADLLIGASVKDNFDLPDYEI